MIKVIRATVIALVSSLAVLSANAAPPTKADAQALVEKAVTLATTGGKAQLLAEVNKKDGEFHKGELYVFVYDLDGTTIAHPVTKSLLGQNNIDKPDSDGKMYRKEIIELAKTKGTGWVEHKATNPVSGKDEPKVSYLKKQGDMVIVAGVYLK